MSTNETFEGHLIFAIGYCESSQNPRRTKGFSDQHGPAYIDKTKMLEVGGTHIDSMQVNPLDPDSSLKAPPPEPEREEAHPPQDTYPEDSFVTKAEKFERHGLASEDLGSDGVNQPPPPKRLKLALNEEQATTVLDEFHTEKRQKGIAPVKPESVLNSCRTWPCSSNPTPP